RLVFIVLDSFLGRGERRATAAPEVWTFCRRLPGRRPAPPAAAARLPEAAGRRRCTAPPAPAVAGCASRGSFSNSLPAPDLSDCRGDDTPRCVSVSSPNGEENRVHAKNIVLAWRLALCLLGAAEAFCESRN